MSVQNKHGMITAFCMIFMYLFGVAISIVGVIFPEAVAEFQVSLADASVVTVAQNGGGILALIFCGYLSDRYGKLRVIVLLFALMAAGLTLALRISGFMGFVALACVLGLCSSALNMAISAYLSDLHGEKSGSFVNLGGAFFGLGSVSGTLYLLLMGRLKATWRAEFGILGFVCAGVLAALLIAFIMHGRREGGMPTPRMPEKRADWSILRDHRLLCYAAVGFFYMAHSSAFMAWAPTYLSMGVGFASDQVSGLMTVYWVAILIGRVLNTALASRLPPWSGLLWSDLTGGAAVLLLLAVKSPLAVAATLALIGVATGSVFQVCLALTCQTFPRQSGTASSAVALCASCGGALCCWATGQLVSGLDFRYGMALLSVCLLAVSLIALIVRGKEASRSASGHPA